MANDLFRSMNLAEFGLNLDTDDLKQAGNLGLWKAVPKFDTAHKVYRVCVLLSIYNLMPNVKSAASIH